MIIFATLGLVVLASSNGLAALSAGYRWGFGAFLIILPVVAAPLTKAQGVLVEEKNNRTVIQTIWFFIVEFDLAGVVLFSTGLVVFFLPSTSPRLHLTVAHIIATIVVGVVLLVIFGLYESFGADPDVINDLRIAEAGYVHNTFDVVSGMLLFFVGFLTRRTGSFKWLLYTAVPLYLHAGADDLLPSSQPVGWLSYLLPSTHLHWRKRIHHCRATRHPSSSPLTINTSLPRWLLGHYHLGRDLDQQLRGGARALSPGAAPPRPGRYLRDLPTQLSYPVGSVIQNAYAQLRMCAFGTVIMGLGLIWMLLNRNIDVRKIEQAKGRSSSVLLPTYCFGNVAATIRGKD
ncbi:hypothetical protein F4801DRAFT_594995 [Xylaria longipes]|nr:hypothetical protein F4801DRAFT_594995 [Xylaria longipes]